MTTKPAAKSAPRMRELRKRLEEAGLAEVRGIIAPPMRHPEVKEAAANVLRKRAKPKEPT
jgi:hypothetical protein